MKNRICTYLFFILILLIINSCGGSAWYVRHPPIFITNKFIPELNENLELEESYDFTHLNDNSCLIIFTYDFTGIGGDNVKGIRFYEHIFEDTSIDSSFIKATFPIDGMKTTLNNRGFAIITMINAKRGKILYAGSIKVDLTNIEEEPKAYVYDKFEELYPKLIEYSNEFRNHEIEKDLFITDFFYFE